MTGSCTGTLPDQARMGAEAHACLTDCGDAALAVLLPQIVLEGCDGRRHDMIMTAAHALRVPRSAMVRYAVLVCSAVRVAWRW